MKNVQTFREVPSFCKKRREHFDTPLGILNAEGPTKGHKSRLDKSRAKIKEITGEG